MLEDPEFSNPAEDGIWLAKSLDIKENQTALDIGCGTGVVTLCAKHLFPNSNFTGMDIQQSALKLAKQNGELNKFDINWLEGDILSPPFKPESFDVVFSNPPFHRTDKGFTSNKNNIAFATTEDMVHTWIENMLTLTKQNGVISLIHHINNIKIIESFAKSYAVDMTELKTSPNKNAKRIIVNIYKKSPE